MIYISFWNDVVFKMVEGLLLSLHLPHPLSASAAFCSPYWMWTISLNIKSPVD